MQPWPYIKEDKRDIANYRPRFILLILKNQMQKKTLVTIISERQSEAIKNIALLYTLFLVFVHTLSSN